METYDKEFTGNVDIACEGDVYKLEVTDGHVQELLMQTHQVAF